MLSYQTRFKAGELGIPLFIILFHNKQFNIPRYDKNSVEFLLAMHKKDKQISNNWKLK